MPHYDVIVVGGAAAGLTSALYASRQGLKTLIITRDVGGQATLTPEIQNYPGFHSIGGLELMQKFLEQAKAFGADVVYDEVTEIVNQEGPCFAVKIRNAALEACAVILAFGKTPRDLGVPGEDVLKGRGVSYCAICDAPLFKGRTVAVAGSGDPAMEAALRLSRLCKKVHLIFAWDRLHGDEELQTQLKARGNIELVPNSKIVEIKGSKQVEAVVLQNTATNARSEVGVEGVFVEMGYVARTEFVRNLVQLNGKREIVIDKNCATNHPGIFAAGDVTDTPYKQAVISAGQGATAAISAYNYLQRLRGRPEIKGDWKTIEKGSIEEPDLKLLP